jgi:O-antigen/teichoic acid export membrane protein
MLGAVPVIQILAIAVAIRVGNASGTILLKGAGQHRKLALVNLTTGLANVGLSVLLIGPYGLPGVAMGTLLPIACSSVFILYPAACRLSGLLVFARNISSGTLLAVMGIAAGGCTVYLALVLLVAIDRNDRELYLTKLRQLAQRVRRRSVRARSRLAA